MTAEHVASHVRLSLIDPTSASDKRSASWVIRHCCTSLLLSSHVVKVLSDNKSEDSAQLFLPKISDEMLRTRAARQALVSRLNNILHLIPDHNQLVQMLIMSHFADAATIEANLAFAGMRKATSQPSIHSFNHIAKRMKAMHDAVPMYKQSKSRPRTSQNTQLNSRPRSKSVTRSKTNFSATRALGCMSMGNRHS